MPGFDQSRDHQIRLAAFAFLDGEVAVRGDVLPWAILSAGFQFAGERVRPRRSLGANAPTTTRSSRTGAWPIATGEPTRLILTTSASGGRWPSGRR